MSCKGHLELKFTLLWPPHSTCVLIHLTMFFIVFNVTYVWYKVLHYTILQHAKCHLHFLSTQVVFGTEWLSYILKFRVGTFFLRLICHMWKLTCFKMWRPLYVYLINKNISLGLIIFTIHKKMITKIYIIFYWSQIYN